MPINWHATLWRGLADEARTGARKIDDSDVKLQTEMLAAHYAAKAVRADRDESSDKAK